MSLETLLPELELLAVEELPIIVHFADDLMAALRSGQTREQAIQAARDAARVAVDALEAAKFPK